MIGSQLRLLETTPPVATVRSGLRPYQERAVEGVLREHVSNRATLMVLFTGGGKTRTACEAMKRHLDAEPSGRALWIAHRDFLIDQARIAIRRSYGDDVSTEQASQRGDGSRVVVGSVQTMKGARLKSWRPDWFSLIIIDEAHHATAAGYREILAHFATAKVLGLTATPVRHDKIGMHNVFDSEAFRFDIEGGIHAGYFVPPVPVARYIKTIDLSNIATQAGDLKLSDLEAEIAKNAAAIAKCTLKDCEDRPTIVYTPGVASAHAVASTLNEAKPGSAVAIDQSTPSARRRFVLKEFGASIQYICNCAIFTEGLDVPQARAIVIARPTKSTNLYVQMVGRGGRPLIGELETREERIAAIAASSKPNFILLDITGKPSRHKLISPADVLGGKEVRGELKERAKKILDEQPDAARTMDEVFALAEEELAEEDKARRKLIAEAALAAKVKARKRSFDPFRRVGVHAPAETGEAPKWNAEPPTSDDREWLKKNRLPATGATHSTVAELRRQAKEWYKAGMANFKQRNMLSRLGCPVDVTFSQASDMLTIAHQNGQATGSQWAKALSQSQIDSVLKRERQPGEDDDR